MTSCFYCNKNAKNKCNLCNKNVCLEHSRCTVVEVRPWLEDATVIKLLRCEKCYNEKLPNRFRVIS